VEPTFWHERWSQGQIGFHQERVHPALEVHGARFLGDRRQRVLVPLCGKSWDLDWLARQGHDVVGVELSETAVAQFHEEHQRRAEVSQEGPYGVWRSENLTILVGDVFDLPGHVGEDVFDRVWDRASMVALPRPMRDRYTRVVRKVAKGGRLLLSTFRYDTSVMSGPPHSIDPDEVHGAYPGVEVLEEDDMVPPGFAARGHRRFEQRLWLAEL
jgi:thiopurine S-methyltransferase